MLSGVGGDKNCFDGTTLHKPETGRKKQFFIASVILDRTQ